MSLSGKANQDSEEAETSIDAITPQRGLIIQYNLKPNKISENVTQRHRSKRRRRRRKALGGETDFTRNLLKYTVPVNLGEELESERSPTPLSGRIQAR